MKQNRDDNFYIPADGVLQAFKATTVYPVGKPGPEDMVLAAIQPGAHVKFEFNDGRKVGYFVSENVIAKYPEENMEYYYMVLVDEKDGEVEYSPYAVCGKAILICENNCFAWVKMPFLTHDLCAFSWDYNVSKSDILTNRLEKHFNRPIYEIIKVEKPVFSDFEVKDL